jgi:hypothetical protein
MPKADPKSLRTYAVLVGVLVAVKILFLAFPTRFPLADQAGAFSWVLIFFVSVLGLIGVYAAPRAGFPEMWDPRVSNAGRLGVSAIDGVVYGLVTVAVDIGHPSEVHLAFPLSVPFYTYGAIFLEILLRLFALPVLTLLLAKSLFRNRGWSAPFWIANVVTSWYEPWPQMMHDLASATRLETPGVVIQWVLSPLFIGNLVAGCLCRRYGFVSAVVLRLVFYAVWHVGYGGFRPFWLAL